MAEVTCWCLWHLVIALFFFLQQCLVHLTTISVGSSTYIYSHVSRIWIFSEPLTKELILDTRKTRALVFHVVLTLVTYWKFFLCNRNSVYCIATVVVFIVFGMYTLSFDIQMCLRFDILDVLFLLHQNHLTEFWWDSFFDRTVLLFWCTVLYWDYGCVCILVHLSLEINLKDKVLIRA